MSFRPGSEKSLVQLCGFALVSFPTSGGGGGAPTDSGFSVGRGGSDGGAGSSLSTGRLTGGSGVSGAVEVRGESSFANRPITIPIPPNTSAATTAMTAGINHER